MLQIAPDQSFKLRKGLKAPFFAAYEGNNVLDLTECIRLFSHKSCADFFLATLEDVLSCDVKGLKRLFQEISVIILATGTEYIKGVEPHARR
jgi:hypothetical protein